MHAVAPGDYELRSINMGRLLNPVPYMAEYYGHKVHVDQNEKLAMYGVTHVVAVDGYSGRIVGAAIMPEKNAIDIYKSVFRPITLENGLWDQWRVDHGREFYLCLAVQDLLSGHRTNTDRCITNSPFPVTTTGWKDFGLRLTLGSIIH